MICKLCLNNRKLVKAHIIPEAFFTGINKTSTASKLISNKVGYRPKRSRIGVYDKEIVCADCEASFHIYDDYAISLFRDRLDSQKKIILEGRFEGYNVDIDYVKLKLFFISLLWRASVSQQDFYNRVRIGKKAEDLRNMYLNQNPGSPETFGVLGFKFAVEPDLVVMMGPWESSSIGTMVITFVFYGLKFSINVSDHSFPKESNRLILSPNHLWPIFFTDYYGSEYWNAAKTLADMQEHKVF